MSSPVHFDWYSLLVDFQTAIVGVLGFLSVILTLRSNSRLLRKQQKESSRQAIAEHNRDTERRIRIVREGIRADLLAVYDVLHLNLNNLSTQPTEDDDVPLLLPRVWITKELMKEVGLLSDLEIKFVTGAMSALFTIEDALRRSDMSRDGSNSAVTISSQFIEPFRSTHESALKAVENATMSLIKNNKIN